MEKYDGTNCGLSEGHFDLFAGVWDSAHHGAEMDALGNRSFNDCTGFSRAFSRTVDELKPAQFSVGGGAVTWIC